MVFMEDQKLTVNQTDIEHPDLSVRQLHRVVFIEAKKWQEEWDLTR
jgi:hypothetical protein